MNEKQRLRCIEEMKKTWKGVGASLQQSQRMDSSEGRGSGSEIRIRYQNGVYGAERILNQDKIVTDGERVKTVTLQTPRTLNDQ